MKPHFTSTRFLAGAFLAGAFLAVVIHIAVPQTRDRPRPHAGINTAHLAELASNAGETGPVYHSASQILRRIWDGGAERGDFEQLQYVIRKGLLSDPKECIDWIARMQIHGILDSADLEQAAISIQTREGDLGALSFALKLDSPKLRDELIQHIIRIVGRRDPAAALDMLSVVPRYLNHDLMSKTVMQWTERDGGSAIRQLTKRRDIPELILLESFKSLAKRDPREAFDILVATDEAEISNRPGFLGGKVGMLSTLFSFMTDISPEQALPMLQTLPSSDFRNDRVAAYIGKMIQKNPGRISEYLKNTDGDLAAARALRESVTEAASHDPMLAVALSRAIPGGKARGLALEDAAKSIVLHSTPKEGAEWALGIQDPLGRASATQQVVKLWLEEELSSRQQAFRFGAENAKTTSNTMFLTLLCSEIANSDPTSDDVSQTLGSLSPDIKQLIRQQVLSKLSEQDRDKLLPHL